MISAVVSLKSAYYSRKRFGFFKSKIKLPFILKVWFDGSYNSRDYYWEEKEFIVGKNFSLTIIDENIPATLIEEVRSEYDLMVKKKRKFKFHS